jgi:hypothetical protein
MLAAYASNIVINNTVSTFVLPSALNDAAGMYTLKATDVVSGATAETKITLR